MKVKFIISKLLKATLKTIICAVIICCVYCGMNAILKKPITADELSVAIATFAIYLHFSEKEL